jgi:hypothetical protein
MHTAKASRRSLLRYTGETLRREVLAVMKSKVLLERYENARDSISFPETVPNLLGTSTKVMKGEKKGVLTAILYLAPHELSVPFGGRNMCAFATPGCIKACLITYGRLAMNLNSTVWKTLAYVHARQWFLAKLDHEITLHTAKAKEFALEAAVRLDGTSDCALARRFAKRHPDCFFYDYTKSPTRAKAWADGKYEANEHVTYSYAETEKNQKGADEVAVAGGNIAVVFRTSDVTDFPETFLGLKVLNADENDIRFRDPRRSCAGLKAKGPLAKRDTTGFVQEITSTTVKETVTA